MKSGCIATADTVVRGLRLAGGVAVVALLLAGCSDSSPAVTATVMPSATASPCSDAWSRMPIPEPKSASSGRGGYLGLATVPGGPLAAMTAISPNDVWAVGALGHGNSQVQLTTLTEHWDGTRWSVVRAPDVALSVESGEPGDLLTGVSAVSTGDVWAVGAWARAEVDDNRNTVDLDQALAEHWNGDHWSVIPTADESNDDILTAVSARSSSDVWAVGTVNHFAKPFLQWGTPLVEHWDGQRWSLVHVPNPGLDPSNTAAVTAAASTTKAYAEASFSAVHAIAADDVWAVGAITPHGADEGAPSQTFTEHWNGSSWKVVNAPDVTVGQLQHGADDSLNAVTATDGDDVWAVGAASPQGTLILHWDGTAWTVVSSARSGFFAYLSDVAAISAKDVWAAGSAIEHWNGRQWTQTATIGGKTFGPLLAVAAASARDVWVVSQDEFLHYTCS